MSKELTVPEQNFIQAILEGNNLTQAAKIVGISQPTATRWYRDEAITKEIQRQLRANKNRIRLRTSQHIDEMVDILVEAARTNGGYSKTQVQAAALVLKYAGAESADVAETSGNHFEIIVNNNTSDTAVEEQAARYNRTYELKQPKPDAPFELIEEE